MKHQIILAYLLLLIKDGPVLVGQAQPAEQPPSKSNEEVETDLSSVLNLLNLLGYDAEDGDSLLKSTTPKPASCPMGWTPFGADCYRVVSEHSFNFANAQEYCNTLGGYLATFEPGQSLQLFLELADFTPRFAWWVGYKYHVHQNGSHWVIDGDSQMADADPALANFKMDTDQVNKIEAEYCGQVRGNLFLYQQVILTAEICSDKSNFLCKKDPVTQCTDRKGQPVENGRKYLPDPNDPCLSCTCNNGQRSMCLSAACGAPNCQYYVSNPDICCSFTCLDPSQSTQAPPDPDPYGDDQSDWLRVDSSMRWVLTSTTSILILGFLLFTVHRLRQRRLAMLSYRNRARHMPAFGPGSGPPPPPDGQNFTVGGAPPPYSFLKPEDEALGAPPSYDDILGEGDSTETPLNPPTPLSDLQRQQLPDDSSIPLREGEGQVEAASSQVAFDSLSTGSSLESTTQDDVPILGGGDTRPTEGGRADHHA